MTLQYAIAGFLAVYIAYREFFKRRAEPEKMKAVPFLVLSLLLTMISMCAFCNSLAQMAGSIFAPSP
jgi:hypothetical protein